MAVAPPATSVFAAYRSRADPSSWSAHSVSDERYERVRFAAVVRFGQVDTEYMLATAPPGLDPGIKSYEQSSPSGRITAIADSSGLSEQAHPFGLCRLPMTFPGISAFANSRADQGGFKSQ